MKRVLVVIDDEVMLDALAEFEVVVSANGLDYFMSLENRHDYFGIVTVAVSDVRMLSVGIISR